MGGALVTYPIPDWTATAVDREVAWLTTSGDSLPSLQAVNGGPWDIVQAYWPGNRLATQKRAVYLTRRVITDDHPAAQRYRTQYMFVAKLIWPVKTPTPPLAENEQRAFDAAIGLFLQRIRGPLGSKDHGGRFLSVGEVPGIASAMVDYDDPEITIQALAHLRAQVTYHADDLEYNG